MTRGGAGRGQGRTPILDDTQALLSWASGTAAIYSGRGPAAVHLSYCRTIRRATPEGRMIADEQDRSHLIPVRVRRHSQRLLSEYSTIAINRPTPSTRRTPDRKLAGALGPTEPQRPYGAKKAILEQAIVWCEAMFGIAITPNLANECWDRYRRVVAYAAQRV